MSESCSYPQKFSSNYRSPRPIEILNGYQFEEGESFFVSCRGWQGWDGFGKSSKSHPGLVILKQKRSRYPVYMIPGTSQPRKEHPRAVKKYFYPHWEPWFPDGKKKAKSTSAYLHLFATPVSRRHIDRFFCVLDNRDIQDLMDLLQSHYGAEWRRALG